MTRPFLRSLLLSFVLALPAAAQDELVKPTHLDKVNTEADEEDPFPTPDGLGLLFARKAKERYAIYQARRAAVGAAFGAGKVLIADKEADFRSPFVHKSFVYFAENRVVDAKLKDLQNFDLVRKIGETAPIPIPGISEKSDELHPWITPAGKEFYFSRKTDDGWLLFVANGPVPGPIGNAKTVGFPVGYHHAALSSNALAMYLQGPLDGERVGLFRSKRAKVGASWSEPEPLKALNHPEARRGDLAPSLSAEGTRLYFASDRPGGKGGLDLWVVPTALLK